MYFGIFQKYSLVIRPCDLHSIITYNVLMVNTSTTTLTNVIFKDSMPPGLTFITGSFIVNGVAVPSANPIVGVDLGTALPNQPIWIIFKAQVMINPPSSYTNLAFAQNPILGTEHSNILTTSC